MDKILVVGGAGYIGSHCVQELQKQGYSAVVIANVPLIPIDIGDKIVLPEVFRQHGPFAAVMHFASLIEVGVSVRDPLSFYRNNVANTVHLLENMVASGTRCLIFSSSAAVYGEPKYTPIDEEHPLQPINPYGHSKRMIEQIVSDCAKAYGICFASMRYFNAAGASPDGGIGEDHEPETHLIPRILKIALSLKNGEKVIPLQIFGSDYPTPDGTCIRDYIHVTDIALAHILAFQYLKHNKSSDFFNLGNGNGYSNQQVLETATRITQTTIPYEIAPRRSGDCAILIASAHKAREILGWYPQYPSLEQIISHAWQWHTQYPQGFASKKVVPGKD
jgi:UDP-glucose 4-epimerase